PAMLKFGVPTETARFAASVGARRRADATALAAMVPAEAAVSFSQFCAWAAAQEHAAVAAVVGDQTARLFLGHAAAFTTPEDAMDMLIAGSGTPARMSSHGSMSSSS